MPRRKETDSEWIRRHGARLGYPFCCVLACEQRFMDYLAGREVEAADGPWVGTGFVPCPICQSKITDTGFDKFVAEEIAPRRHPSLPPFPDWD